MMRASMLPLLLLGPALTLEGCAASIAASAVGAAVQAGRGRPAAVPDLTWAAAEACGAHAVRYGEVHIIDVEQRGGKALVWGTVGAGEAKRAFRCSYAGKVSGFKLRAIAPRG
jgi:hypothetical protein